MATLRQASYYGRHHGWGTVTRLIVGNLATRLLAGPLRLYRPPSLGTLARAARSAHTDPEGFLQALTPGWGARPLSSAYAEVAQDLVRRYQAAMLPRAETYALETASSLVLYNLVRHLAPEVVVETGVANGHSTYVILRALEANGSGVLHSTDISADVGQLVDQGLRSRWQLHVLDASEPEVGLRRLLQGLGPIDLFLHDGDHRYLSQMFEYRVATAHARPGALLLSDDIDANHAFIDFCREIGARPVLLVEPRKVFGAVLMP